MNILDKMGNTYTTRGNDGIISFILKCIGLDKGIFVEFGAADGVRGSNCRRLSECGWSGLFIETQSKLYNKLVENYKDNPNIVCRHAAVNISGNNTFDEIVSKYFDGETIDFCSIDIDGLDLQVFKSFKEHMPTVVCIEGGQMLEPFAKKISPSKEKMNIQQSLSVMNNLFKKRDYKILCSHQDSFFIKAEHYYKFDVSNDLYDLYFDGLKVSFHRLPFIQGRLKKCKMKNTIVDYVLRNTSYKRYGWKKRKQWEKDKKRRILARIATAKKKFRRKFSETG